MTNERITAEEIKETEALVRKQLREAYSRIKNGEDAGKVMGTSFILMKNIEYLAEKCGYSNEKLSAMYAEEMANVGLSA